MEPKSVTWKLDAHTLGKHKVLRAYLDAWLPIMGRWNGRILFIDGFAGPGEYQGGEDGSPIIALKALAEHRAKGQIAAEVCFMFIEQDPARAAHLERLVQARRPALPSHCEAQVITGAFDETMEEVLNQLDQQAARLAPCFVMIDPFGVRGTPMAVIRRILRNPKCEAYVSLMYEWINRFLETPEFAAHLDALFGTPEWRNASSIDNPEDRKEFLYSLYERELRGAGCRYVIHFELYEGARLVYAIFFGTQDLTGCDRMKQAIWKVVPFGDFAFRGARHGQLTLILANPNLDGLKSSIAQQYRGRGWIPIEEILDFVRSDETLFHSSQLKKGALVPMEQNSHLEVKPGSRKKRYTYPDGTLLRFL